MLSLFSLAVVNKTLLGVTFTSDTLIDASDYTYDANDIIVAGCTLTVNGQHTFNSFQIIGEGMLTHSAAPNGEQDNRIDLTIIENLIIEPNSLIDVDGKGYYRGIGPGAGSVGSAGGGGGYGGNGGYSGPSGTDTGGNAYGSIIEPNDLGSGGGNDGGRGGDGGGRIRFQVGGELRIDGQITANGTDGTNGYFMDRYTGGGGSGGSIYIVAGSLTGVGGIRANGGIGSWHDWGNWEHGGGGGGGRIAIYYGTSTFAGTMLAAGGSGYQYGGAGTIYTKATNQAYGDLLIDNNGNDGAVTPLLEDHIFDNAEIINEGNLTIPSGILLTLVPSVLALQDNGTMTVYGLVFADDLSEFSQINVSSGADLVLDGDGQIACNQIELSYGGTLILNGNGHVESQQVEILSDGILILNKPEVFPAMHIGSGGELTHSAGHAGFDLTIIEDLLIDAEGTINVDGKGYYRGIGPGAGSVGSAGGGGGYGGNGGYSGPSGTDTGGNAYGSIIEPNDLGSGGGNDGGRGGDGGGRIRFQVGGELRIDGQITANGTDGTNGYFMDRYTGGGGSGGSIYIVAGSLTGVGGIRANGGIGSWHDWGNWEHGGGGGGGRIAIYYGTSTFAGTMLAAGGSGYQYGGAGTIYTKATNQAYGDLLIDNNGNDGAVTPLFAQTYYFQNVDILNSAKMEAETGCVIHCEDQLIVGNGCWFNNTVIYLSRFRFEDNSTVMNNTIYTRSNIPYGYYFIGDTVTVIGNYIFTDGDRFLDLEPEYFLGSILFNRIHIAVREGVNHTRGGLLECRGQDIFCTEAPCEPGAYQVAQVPDFDITSWTIEKLELIPDAKLNLTNRIDFQAPYDFGGEDEVLYVKELEIGEGAILNTGFNRLYYETLIGDPNAIVNRPLLGFSLFNITMDDDTEYRLRTTHNNYIHKTNSDYDRLHIQRIDGVSPDPSGMMRMQKLLDFDPNSTTYQQDIHARAKGFFAKTAENEVLIRFEYLFENDNPHTELVVYLSDMPYLMEPNDPLRPIHYRKIGSIPVPPIGRPGSPGSARFGVFEKIVPVGSLNFLRGTYIELELAGPAGASVLINNWDPYVYCIYCMDTDGDMGVTATDYLTTIGEYGKLTSSFNKFGQSIGCLDAIFCVDGCVNLNDILAWDWVIKQSDGGNLCFEVPSTESAKENQPSSLFGIPDFHSNYSPPNSGFDECGGFLLIAGKRFSNEQIPADYLSDRLYNFNEQGNLVCDPYQLTDDRLNSRLTRDPRGRLYQLHFEKGLRQVPDEDVAIAPGDVSVVSEPRYQQAGTVHIGLKGQGIDWVGRPILDVVFDNDGYAYIAPVVVEPNDHVPYLAAAKLKLDPNEFISYGVEQIYAYSPLANDNLDPNHLREIEVDNAGNVYVLNSYHLNESDTIWKYNNQGELIDSVSLAQHGIKASLALCVSRFDDSLLYLAASNKPSEATSSVVYVLSTEDFSLVHTIDIQGMGHITDITEDPQTGNLWAVGFTMENIPDYVPVTIPPFYYPYFANIPYNSAGAIPATDIRSEGDLTLPLSVLWIKLECGGADLDSNRNVGLSDLYLLARHWLQDDTNPDWLDPVDLDDSGFINLGDLGVMGQHWLKTGCRE
jgi:hypothetical protein